MDQIISANMKGDFAPQFKAYGRRVPLDRLKTRWAEVTKEIEDGTATSFATRFSHGPDRDRDETVVRFHCRRGAADRTYDWTSVKKEASGHVNARTGLAPAPVPSGEREFFTWDGGLRPPKPVRFETGADGQMRLTAGAAKNARGCPKPLAKRGGVLRRSHAQ